MKKIIIAFVLIFSPIFVFAQDGVQKETVQLFFMESCPHCHNVDKFFNENGVYDKYEIEKLDASSTQNSQLLMELYEKNGYPENQRGGVPAASFGNEFVIGDKPIIDSFSKKMGISSNEDQASVLGESDKDVPDPSAKNNVIEPASKKAISENLPENPENQGENKKNYIPLVLVGVIIFGAGFLIFLNSNE